MEVTTLPVVKLHIEQGIGCFTASVKYCGKLISAKGGKEGEAISKIEKQLDELKAPRVYWRKVYKFNAGIKKSSIIGESFPEEVKEEESGVKITSTPSFLSEGVKEEGSISEPDDIYTREINRLSFPRMDQGLVTPFSDMEVWCARYREAVTVATQLMGEDFSKERGARFRYEVNSYMEHGDGRIPCIGAYRQMPSGDRWIRVTGEYDPTVKQPKAGEGKRRAQHWRDINGNWVNVSGKERSFKPRDGYKYPGLPEQRSRANLLGKAMSAKAAELGHNDRTREVWYKIGFVVSLRSQNAPYHSQFESELMVFGIKEETLREFARRVEDN